jgi:uncharacterized glyoxalase superfamily protein PhnB
MTANRSVPTDSAMPHLAYPNVADAVAWLVRVFGFTEHYRYGGNGGVSGAQIYLGGSYIMIHSKPGQPTPAQLGYGTQSLTIFVDDVDKHFATAKREGARIVEEVHETIYGERQYGAEDFAGHNWLFSWHARDTAPEEWGAIVAKSPF